MWAAGRPMAVYTKMALLVVVLVVVVGLFDHCAA